MGFKTIRINVSHAPDKASWELRVAETDSNESVIYTDDLKVTRFNIAYAHEFVLNRLFDELMFIKSRKKRIKTLFKALMVELFWC